MTNTNKINGIDIQVYKDDPASVFIFRSDNKNNRVMKYYTVTLASLLRLNRCLPRDKCDFVNIHPDRVYLSWNL